MLWLINRKPSDDISEHAGSYVHSFTDYPTPGRLPADGSLVSKTTFPNLFKKLGHLYTSGSKAGNGTEGDLFRLPNPAGRFLKPTHNGVLPGTLTEDRLPAHQHSVSSGAGSHGSHFIPVWPMVWQGSYGHSHHGEYDPTYASDQGHNGTGAGSTSYAGDHTHSYSFSASGDPETRPYGFTTPTYIVTGELSGICAVIVYGHDWKTTPGFNEIITAKTGLEVAFAKENVHTYRVRFPEVAGGPVLASAHMELFDQLKTLRSKYSEVWIIGIGTGAHIAAMAMTVYNDVWIATKFVGINGIYDLTAPYSPSFESAVTGYLGGSTQALRVAGTPIKPYYPAKCWHGANNALIPPAQSQAFAETVVVPNLPHGSNPIAGGIFPDILTFLKS